MTSVRVEMCKKNICRDVWCSLLQLVPVCVCIRVNADMRYSLKLVENMVNVMLLSVNFNLLIVNFIRYFYKFPVQQRVILNSVLQCKIKNIYDEKIVNLHAFISLFIL